jgi:hypothetical protein
MRKRAPFSLALLAIALALFAGLSLFSRRSAGAETTGVVEPLAYLSLILTPPLIPTPTLGPNTPSPTSPSESTPTNTPAPGTATPTLTPPDGEHVQVGFGFSDVTTHQVVRTSGDRVYILAGELHAKPLHIYRADAPGTPNAFGEPDLAHRPQAQVAISSVEAAIDGNNLIHVIWLDNAGPTWYQTFNTATDTWGSQHQLTNSPWPAGNNGLRQGSAGVALALDASGVAHVVYTKVSGNKRGLYYNNNTGGTWNHEQRLDDQAAYNNGHPALAFKQDGTLFAAWLTERGVNQGDIRIRSRSAAGVWAAQSTLIDKDMFADTIYSIDQGPSLLVTPDGTLHIAYIGAYEPVQGAPGGYAYGRIHHKYSANGVAWTADDPPTVHYTHNPSLATDAAGTLYLFGHEEAWLRNSCASLYMYTKPAGGSWPSNWSLMVEGCVDSSVSVKWSANFWNHPEVVDLVFWTQQEPNVLYYKQLP